MEGNFPTITLPDKPDLEDAKQAATVLLEPFSEFPFVDLRQDQSCVLAYMFTLALRAQLSTAPLTCVSATTPGSGKGLLIEACNRAMRGRNAATMPPVQGSAGEDETRKRITALLLRGIPSINMDNWTKPIGGESMNTLLTTTEWTDRQLGASRPVSVPANITLAATGNNLSVRGDMTRRAILIQLDPGMERPGALAFAVPDLLGHIKQHRGEMLTAVFTILKAFRLAGSPGSDKHLLGRFEEWSAAVCAPYDGWVFRTPSCRRKNCAKQDPEAEKLRCC
ncbi:MAG: hypothetical protein IPG06_16800 [Haliea sp.]|nr:hypothetical protein [Haliea sp.]